LNAYETISSPVLQAPVSVTEPAPGQVSVLERAPVSQQAAQEAAMQPVFSHNRKKKR
jgi:hypothetical protein